MQQFAAIGEAMIELCHQGPRSLAMSFAGDALNLSTYLVRLVGTSLAVNYVTALGDDPYSDMMVNDWVQEKINTQFVQRIPNKLPGLYLIRTDDKGERYLYFYRFQSAARELFKLPHIDELCARLVKMNYLYLTSVTLAIFDETSREKLIQLLIDAKKQGVKILFDTNYRHILWPNVETTRTVLRKIAPLIDIILPTFNDEQAVFNDPSPQACAERWHNWGVKEVVIKQGAAACLVSYDNKQTFVNAEIAPHVVDTTAAGDSFNAAYLAARIRNFSPIEAARAGHQLAAVVIAHPGAIIPPSAMPVLFK